MTDTSHTTSHVGSHVWSTADRELQRVLIDIMRRRRPDLVWSAPREVTPNDLAPVSERDDAAA